jgi:hypothetical protein
VHGFSGFVIGEGKLRGGDGCGRSRRLLASDEGEDRDEDGSGGRGGGELELPRVEAGVTGNLITDELGSSVRERDVLVEDLGEEKVVLDGV